MPQDKKLEELYQISTNLLLEKVKTKTSTPEGLEAFTSTLRHTLSLLYFRIKARLDLESPEDQLPIPFQDGKWREIEIPDLIMSGSVPSTANVEVLKQLQAEDEFSTLSWKLGLANDLCYYDAEDKSSLPNKTPLVVILELLGEDESALLELREIFRYRWITSKVLEKDKAMYFQDDLHVILTAALRIYYKGLQNMYLLFVTGDIMFTKNMGVPWDDWWSRSTITLENTDVTSTSINNGSEELPVEENKNQNKEDEMANKQIKLELDLGKLAKIADCSESTLADIYNEAGGGDKGAEEVAKYVASEVERKRVITTIAPERTLWEKYKDLPLWQQILIGAGVAGAVAGVGYLIYNTFSSNTEEETWEEVRLLNQ